MKSGSDADLVVAALGGDRVALGQIYDRYSDDIYSFAMSRLRNRDQAADATQETFLMAATRLSTLRQPERLRAWMFAIARNKIVDQVRIAQRSHTDVTENMMIDNAEPSAGLESVESAALLWDAAGSLTDRDQDLLELSVRHGLGGEDLADALGVALSHLHVLKSRMNDRLKKAIGALLVARVGAEDCDQLADLLTGWDGRYTLEVRSRVTRHVAECDRCDQKQTAIISSGMAYGMLPLMPAPAALRGQTIEAMADAITNTGSAEPSTEPPQTNADAGTTTTGWRHDGFPTVAERSIRPAAVTSKAILAIVIGIFLLAGITLVAFLAITSDGQETAITSSVANNVDGAADAPTSSAPAPASTPNPSETTGSGESGSSTTPTSSATSSPSTDTTTSNSATSSSTNATSSSTTSTTEPDPARLVVETPSVSFGLADTASILLINAGGSPASYSITVDSPFSVAAGDGVVAAGATETILVAVDRSGLPTGTVAGQAAITTASGQLSSSLTAIVDRKPSIDRLVVTTSIECGGFFAVATVVLDDDDLTSVDLSWNGPGVNGAANLGNSTGSHAGEFGPIFASADGTLTVVVTATDTAGQTTSRAADVPISNCP